MKMQDWHRHIIESDDYKVKNGELYCKIKKTHIDVNGETFIKCNGDFILFKNKVHRISLKLLKLLKEENKVL